MTNTAMLREQIKDARDFFEATLSDVTPELARWQPDGKAVPIGAHYAHVLVSEDMGLHGLLLGRTPIAAGTLAGKTGFTELPPLGVGQAWESWARASTFDLAGLRRYAEAIYAATDDYLTRATDDTLARTVDLTPLGLGEQTTAWLLTTGWVTNVHLHCGEISCLKGLRGLRGYPV